MCQYEGQGIIKSDCKQSTCSVDRSTESMKVKIPKKETQLKITQLINISPERKSC
jgi:hypothetical protein